MDHQRKSLPKKGQASACNTWQPGYHNAFKRRRPFGFASPPFGGFALNIRLFIFDLCSSGCDTHTSKEFTALFNAA